MASKQIKTSEHAIHLDDESVFLFTNKLHGNVAPHRSADALANQGRALQVVGRFTGASALATMRPNHGRFVILDEEPRTDIYDADALLTSNPEDILHVRPADCGVVAVKGFGAKIERDTFALLHVSRHVIDMGAHLRALEQMVDTYGVDPETLSVYVGPSARQESYKFPEIDEAQKTSPLWRDYVHEDEQGLWHVDFHRRAVDDLRGFGIPMDSIEVSDIDTAGSPDYFSNMRANKGIDVDRGTNGAFFALRKPSTR